MNDERDCSTDHYGMDPNPWATRAVKAEAELAAAEEDAAKMRGACATANETNTRRGEKIKRLETDLTTSRSDAVREFAEWLTTENAQSWLYWIIEGGRKITVCDLMANFLASGTGNAGEKDGGDNDTSM
jgi:hypothetical protein